MTELDWSDFKLMLALSRGGSVAGAARLLGVDGSTISRRLSAMEALLGACLVVRGGRDFSLTHEGKSAVAAAEAMEPIVASATSAIRASKTDIAGVVRISSVPGLVRFLAPLSNLVSAAHPRLSIELSAASRMVDVAKGEADIAIRMARPTETALIGKKALELELGVYVAKSYVAKYGAPQTFEELRRHRLVQYVTAMHHLPWFRWIEQYADANAAATRVDGTEMAHTMVASGAGIGVLFCFAGDQSPDLLRVFPDPVANVEGWIVYHEAERNTARIRAVVDLLGEFFAERKDLLQGRRK